MILLSLFNPFLLPRCFWRNRQLLAQWTRRLLAMRYAGSFMGPLWNFATPLMMLGVYTFVFGVVFRTRWTMLNPDVETTSSYAIILFCGMAIFNIFSETALGSCRCVVDNANLVKKVIFPLEILPLSQMLCALISGQVWFALVLAAMFIAGLPLPWTMLLFPLVLFPLVCLAAGIGWFVAATAVYLRDLPHLVAMLVQALFFMTPVFYPESLAPPQFAFIFEINPLAWLCGQGRSLLIFGVVPPISGLLLTWAVCLGICQSGFIWFVKVKKGFADVL